MDPYTDKEMDEPLSESSVSLQLSLIRKRCGELMKDPDELGLSLEEPETVPEGGDPYNHRS